MNKYTKKVSVIVPVYNAGKTLARLLGNLLHQTLSDMEVILIDDCSTDGSAQIMQDAKEQFPDKVILLKNDTNSGPGASRNKGIEAASGEYIGFADADDMVDVSMYEKLYDEAVRTEADLVDCAHALGADAEDVVIQISEERRGKASWKTKSDMISAGGYVWSKLYSHSMIDRYHIRFNSTYILEDTSFMMLSLYHARILSGVDDVLYVYMNTPDSLSKNKSSYEYIQAAMNAVGDIFEKMSALPEYDKVQMAVERIITWLLINSYRMAEWMDNSNSDTVRSLLSSLMRVTVSFPLEKNPYIIYGISDDDKKVLRELTSLR